MVALILPIALTMLAQTSVQASADASGKAASAKPEPRCGVPIGSDTIIVCAEKPDGYRINPDVVAARRGMKPESGAPHPNNPAVRPDCATVGPAPCLTAGINLIGAALTAAEITKRLASGQEIGSMFKTDPTPTEYQRYQMAKAEREAREAADAAAKAKARAVAAQAAQQAAAK